MASIKIEINNDDGSVLTYTITGDTELDAADKHVAFAINNRNKLSVETAATPVITVVLPNGIHAIDEEKLKIRFVYLGLKDAACKVLRLKCMGYTSKQIEEMPGKNTVGSVNSQIYVVKQLIGDFSKEELIDICICENADYNIKYYDLIENFKIENACTYRKQKPL